MVAPAPRTHDHRLCLIRDAFAHEYEKMLRGYHACPTDVFKGACKGIEICDRIVLRALDLEEIEQANLSQDRDRLDHLENQQRQPSPFNFLSALCLVALVLAAGWWWGLGE